EPRQTDNVTLAGNLNADTSQSKVVQAQSGFTTNSGNVAKSTTELNDLSQTTTNLQSGDVINFDIVDSGGNPVTSVSFEYGTDGTQLGEMVTEVNDDLTAAGVEGELAISDGLLILRS